jgi:hypothetical protein
VTAVALPVVKGIADFIESSVDFSKPELVRSVM